MSTKAGKKYLDKNGLSYFRQKLKEELKNEQLWEQGENIDGTEGGVQIAYYGNAVGEASVSEGVAYNYKKSNDEILPISIKSLISSEKSIINQLYGGNYNYNYIVKIDFSSIDDPVVSSIYELGNKGFNLSLCEYVENAENPGVSELAVVKNVYDISNRKDIISIFTDKSEFSQLEISNEENLNWGLLELDDISINKNSTYIIGISTGAFGIASHAEGNYTTANGDYSHAEGEYTRTEGSGSHTEGSGSIGIGEYSHAEGLKTKTEGDYSHAEGHSSVAVGAASHAEGTNTQAEGESSHAEGSSSLAKGHDSHAEGYYSQAEGDYSHTEGYRTIANNTCEHAEGEYNKSNTGTISSIGIGTREQERKNAVEVMKNGDMYVYGLGDYDGTNAVDANSEGKKGKSLQDYISNIETTPGIGLEFEWNGTELGVKREDEDDFEYTDLIGPTGEGLDFYCDGYWLGIKKESDDSYEEYYVKGDPGDQGPIGIGFGYLGCSWDQYEMIMNRMYLDESGTLQTTSNDDEEIPDNCIKILDKFPGLSAEYFSHWLDNIYNWLNHTSNTFVLEKYINYLKETEPDIYSDLYNYLEDIAYSYILLFVQSNILGVGLNALILPIAPWGDFATVGSSNIVFGGNIHSYRGGNSILFYEDEITTDTNNKADVPASFSVRVGDLVIDENFNLYKCIEE
jgi:hypothetical protein